MAAHLGCYGPSCGQRLALCTSPMWPGGCAPGTSKIPWASVTTSPAHTAVPVAFNSADHQHAEHLHTPFVEFNSTEKGCAVDVPPTFTGPLPPWAPSVRPAAGWHRANPGPDRLGAVAQSSDPRTREQHAFDGKRPAVRGLPCEGQPLAGVGAHFSRFPVSFGVTLEQAGFPTTDRNFLLRTPIPLSTVPWNCFSVPRDFRDIS